LAQLADDPTTDLLDSVCNVSIAGWIGLDKTRLETLVSAIKKDALDDDKRKTFGVRIGTDDHAASQGAIHMVSAWANITSVGLAESHREVGG
jgi:hypothetical protein